MGGEPWNGQMQRWMDGVPDRQGVPESEEEYDTALYRPVFFSSQVQQHPAKAVASGIGFMEWLPEETDENPWVMVDLEGPRKLSRICIIPSKQDVQFEAEISADGKQYMEYGCAAEIIPEGPVRYVRVRMMTQGQGINEIECYE